MRLRLPILTAVLGAALLPAAAGAALDTSPRIHPPTATAAWTAELLAPVVARRAPRAGARPIATVSPIGEIGGDATGLLVTGVRSTAGVKWARLLLPRRPNGAQGWVPVAELTVKRISARVVIDTRARTLTLFRGRRAVLRTRVAIGRSQTPTPLGRHAVAETIRTNDPGSFFGPVVLPLTAHSDVIQEFQGGKGRVAIHGTSLPQLLGTRASLGCVRMSNATVVRLAKFARPGTPVLIR